MMRKGSEGDGCQSLPELCFLLSVGVSEIVHANKIKGRKLFAALEGFQNLVKPEVGC